MRENKGYLTHPECPYSERFKNALMGLKDEQREERASDVEIIDVEKMSDDEITAEISMLYSRLNDYWTKVRDSEKSADKNTYFRITVSLLEKIVEIREKMTNLSSFNAYEAEVLSIMTEIMDADQRNEMTTRLERFSRK